MTYKIDWTEHPNLDDIDRHVADKFERDVIQAFSSASPYATNLKTYKEEVVAWVEDRIFEWQEVLKMLKDLPDDEKQTYILNEETDEVVEDEEVLE